MAFTVSCTACGSRFLLGDDLFRRKVSGNIVKVKCRNCEAEISVDARDVDTLPSHESPRRAPAPPRPKEKVGLSAPTAISDAAESIWDSEQTVSISGKSAPAPANQEAEFVDFEEIPASSSDAPALSALTHDAGSVKPPRRKRATDDFLINLSAGTNGILGAPTIDVSNLGTPHPPSIESSEIEPELSTQRQGTRPLFDMSAVMPAASAPSSLASASAVLGSIESEPLLESAPPLSTAKPRERKHVVPPQEVEAAPKTRRSGAPVWLGAVLVSAAVLALVGLHGHRARQATAAEAQRAPEHPTAIGAALPTADLAAATSGDSEIANTEPSAAPAAGTASASAVIASAKAAYSGVKSAPASSAPRAEQQPGSATSEVAAPTENAAALEAPAAEPRNAIAAAAPGTQFDRAAAIEALKGAASQASSCRKDGDPSGTATLTITFAASGRVTSATLQGPPFAGTPTGGCIANAMRHTRIPAFDGDRVTVTKTVVIE